MDIFNNTDACVEPVLSLSEALNDPHTKKRNMVVELDLPLGGKMRQLASPIKFPDHPGNMGKPVCPLALIRKRFFANWVMPTEILMSYERGDFLIK